MPGKLEGWRKLLLSGETTMTALEDLVTHTVSVGVVTWLKRAEIEEEM